MQVSRCATFYLISERAEAKELFLISARFLLLPSEFYFLIGLAMPNILAFDSSAEACSVCLKTDTADYVRAEATPRQHAKLLLPMIEGVLAEANLKLAELDAIALGQGPGSFTGLRIAAGVAQGLSYGADLQAVPLSNLKGMARQAQLCWPEADYVLVAFDARMDELYYALFKLGEGLEGIKLVGEESLAAPEQVLQNVDWLAQIEPGAQCVGIGSGFNFYQRLGPDLQGLFAEFDAEVQPSAEALAELATQAMAQTQAVGEQQEGITAKDIKPSYLRNEVSWKKLPHKT